jgi:predicted ATP-grasp superfamily ATP-dependent carboligase
VADRVLILSDASTTYRAMSVVRCLHDAGLKVYVLSASGSRAFSISRLCAGAFTCSIDDVTGSDQTIIDRINGLAERLGIAVIVPVDIQSVLCVSRIQSRLKAAVFPVPEPELLIALNDKWSFTVMMRELGLGTPASVTLDKARTGELSVETPAFIVKPRALEGGVGVRRFTSFAAVGEFVSKVAKPDDWIVQEFVPGVDFDYSALADKGRVVTSTVERRPSPGRVEFTTDPEVLAAGNQIISALGLNGAVNIDMRRDSRDGSLRILDCNPLLWDTIAAPAAFGLNIPLLGTLMALKRELPGPKSVTAGNWVAPRRLVKDLLDRDQRAQISAASWSSLRRTLADPLPWLYQLLVEPRAARRRSQDLALS